MAEDLVRGEGFAIDASVVKADANRQRGVPSTESIDWRMSKSLRRPGVLLLWEVRHVKETDLRYLGRRRRFRSTRLAIAHRPAKVDPNQPL